jgi:hypothetical protein
MAAATHCPREGNCISAGGDSIFVPSFIDTIVFDTETSALPLENFDEAQQEYLFQNWISTWLRRNP